MRGYSKKDRFNLDIAQQSVTVVSGKTECMNEVINITVSTKELKHHISRVCRANLDRGAKICITCPFREGIHQFMLDNPAKR